MDKSTKISIWLQWVAANAIGEMLGLGLTFAAGVGLFMGIEPTNLLQALLLIFLMTATGIIEGTILGFIQWLVLRRIFVKIRLRTWVIATLTGALIAWFLGSIPSSLMSMQSDTAAAEGVGMQEPSAIMMMGLAAGMGLVLGIFLAFPQWLVLRKHTRAAGWWFLGNSAGWAVGMPIIFSAVGWAYDTGSIAAGILLMAALLLLTGAVVGAVHGIILLKLAGTRVYE